MQKLSKLVLNSDWRGNHWKVSWRLKIGLASVANISFGALRLTGPWAPGKPLYTVTGIAHRIRLSSSLNFVVHLRLDGLWPLPVSSSHHWSPAIHVSPFNALSAVKITQTTFLSTSPIWYSLTHSQNYILVIETFCQPEVSESLSSIVPALSSKWRRWCQSRAMNLE